MSDIESDTDEQKILAVTEEEATAIEAGDLEKYLSLLGPEAVFMPPNVSEKIGDDLRTWLREFLERVRIKFKYYDHGETIVREDLAFHCFTCGWTATPRPSGARTMMFFKGMHILQRQPDGAWKIVREIWNTDPEPEG